MSADTLLDFNAAGGAALVADGPIVGFDEPALTIPATDYLTTGDLTNGDAGDAGNIGLWSVEFWFRTPTLGTQQILAQGPNAHAAVPNRQWTVYLAAAGPGLGKIKFDHVDGTNTNYSLTGNTLLKTNTWYHVAAVKDGTTAYIYLNGVQDGSLAVNAPCWGDLIAGSADMRIGATTTTYAMDFAEFAFYREAMNAARALAHYQAGAQRGFAAQTTHTRFFSVLDQVTSTAPRGGSPGAVAGVTPRYMTGQSPLDLMREANQSDASGGSVDPMLFVAADGTLMFLAGDHRSVSPWNTLQATFGDQTGELGYVDITLDYSDSYLANEINVTREGTARVAGQTQTQTDSTSLSRYLRRPLNISGVPLDSDVLALNMAAGLLAKYKNPMLRVTSIELSTVDPLVAWSAFQREIGDKIRILRTPPGGGSRIQQDVWIQKIDIAGSNDGTPLSIRWSVSPL